jgi:hypothetical protein
MGLNKRLNTGLQVGALIGHNGPRQTGFFDRFLQLLKHHLTLRAGDRVQGDRFHILVGQREIRGELAQTHSQDQQAFLHPQLNRVIDNPDPIVCLRFGSHELVIAEA